MNKINIFLLAIFSLYLVTGCQEPIDLELPDVEPELVVEAYLTDRDYFVPEGDLDCSGLTVIPKVQIEAAIALVDAFINIDSIEAQANYFPFNKVQLTTTANYFSNSAAPTVSGATVKLFENGTEVETLVEDIRLPGTYRITHDPVVGASYHLQIDALGNFYTTKEEVYNSVPPLIGLNAVYSPNFLGDSCAYYMGIDTYEKPGIGDNYRWMFYINNRYDNRPGFISTFDDSEIDGLCLFGLDIYGDELELGDTLIVFQMRTSEGYTNFMNSLRNQTAFVGGPFDTPPAPIKGNITNETTGKPAFGYFVAGGISANATVVPETIPAEGCGI